MYGVAALTTAIDDDVLAEQPADTDALTVAETDRDSSALHQDSNEIIDEKTANV